MHASFAANALQQVALQLGELKRSEKVLRDTPKAAERQKTLLTLADQLEKVRVCGCWVVGQVRVRVGGLR